ncbi:alpha-L-arabinofuranosidase C-terminal domain-containing protein [Terriglobus sp.]|uniref:alpha-L-arabinofuranosidase C-terminal domain-containing protein n=1 Tax=Terriglobus sp. TaxID=1889013 RepID=UPI003B000228
MVVKHALLVAVVSLCSGMTAFCQLTEKGDTTQPVLIRVTRPAAPAPIPDSVFGSFLEPIGKSTYGGLWADVVENPSFEEGLWSVGNVEELVRERPGLRRASSLGLPLPWEPLTDQGARYLPVVGDAANSTDSLLLMSLPGKETGIRQQVYLPVKRELTYLASVYLKHVSGPAEVTFSIRGRNKADQVLASAKISTRGADWAKYSATLTLPPGAVVPLEPADFVIATDNDARVLVDQASLMPRDNLDGLDPDEVAMARDLHSPLIRYGGNFTSAYNWHDGVGPRDKRVSKVNISWGIPEYNTFGTDEFLHFCRLIQAEPQVAVNLGTGSPQEAADWVRYVNQHWPNPSGSHPGGLLWELGNELWGTFQEGYPSQERVAAKTLATAQAIHKVDPHARLIATGADEDHFKEWNAVQLANPVGTFDYLSTHFVVRDQILLRDAPPDFLPAALLALPIGLEKQLDAIHDQIQSTPQRDHVKTAFTEWLLISGDTGSPNYDNMGGALFTAGFLNSVIRKSDIVPVSDMTGIMEFGGIWKKKGVVYGTPAYWVLREYASAKPTELLSVSSNSPSYSIHNGPRRLPEIDDVPYLDVVATTADKGKKLVLLCVNRHLTRGLSANFDLSSLGQLGTEATIDLLHAQDLHAANTPERPTAVQPSRSSEALGSTFHHTFPAASVTVVQIPLK